MTSIYRGSPIPMSPLEALLGGVGSGITQGAQEYRENRREQQKQEQLFAMLGLTPPPQNDGYQQPPQQQPQAPSSMPEESNPEEGFYAIPKGAPMPPALMGEREAIALSIVSPTAAKAKQAQQDAQEKQFSRKIASHERRSERTLMENDERSETLEEGDLAHKQMMDAIINQDTSRLNKDKLADLPFFQRFVSADGALLIQGVKQAYVANLQKLNGQTVRNQWIEKQIFQAFPSVGRSPYANAVMAEAQGINNEIIRKRVELTNDISNSWREQLGYVPGNLNEEVTKQLKPFAKEKEKELEQRIKEIKAAEKAETNLSEIPRYNNGQQLKPLTNEEKLSIFKEAGSNPEEALRIAKERGYDV